MTPELTDEQAAALLKELNEIIDGDRYFMSQRIRTLKEIPSKIRPEPAREPLPPPPKQCPAASECGKEAARRALSTSSVNRSAGG